MGCTYIFDVCQLCCSESVQFSLGIACYTPACCNHHSTTSALSSLCFSVASSVLCTFTFYKPFLMLGLAVGSFREEKETQEEARKAMERTWTKHLGIGAPGFD